MGGRLKSSAILPVRNVEATGAVKLTVCTAVLNATRSGCDSSLERCIRSVAALPFKHEHLVFDGGSDDGTVEVLRSLESEIPTLRVAVGPDSGIYNALNKGVRDAQGEYFYVLGSDDWICDPAALDDTLREAFHLAVDIMVSPVLREGEGAWSCARSDVFDMLGGMPYSHQGALVRTSLIRSLGGYDVSYRIVADYKLHLLAHLRGARTECLWRPFARVGVCGLSGRNPKLLQQEGARVRCEAFGLSGIESDCHCRTGTLPLAKWIGLVRSHEPFTRRVGWTCARRWLWHKHKGETFSTWRLAGIPVFTWRRRKRGT